VPGRTISRITHSSSAEIEFLDVLVLAQRLCLAVEHHAPVLENVAVARVAQRHERILLGEQKGNFLLLVQRMHDVENLLDDLRRESHRRLVEQDHFRLRHQRPADRGHLLLAARGVAGERGAPLLELRKIGIDPFEILPDRGIAVAPREGAGEQVFLDRQMREALPAFHHLDAAAAHQFVGRKPVHGDALELDRALGDFTALGVQQIGNRLERRRLARAVRTEQRDDAALRHLKRHALQHQDHVVVDDLDIVDRQSNAPLASGIVGRSGGVSAQEPHDRPPR
jgi:hypothetical protein